MEFGRKKSFQKYEKNVTILLFVWLPSWFTELDIQCSSVINTAKLPNCKVLVHRYFLAWRSYWLLTVSLKPQRFVWLCRVIAVCMTLQSQSSLYDYAESEQFVWHCRVRAVCMTQQSQSSLYDTAVSEQFVGHSRVRAVCMTLQSQSNLYDAAESEQFVWHCRVRAICMTLQSQSSLYDSAESEQFVWRLSKMRHIT